MNDFAYASRRAIKFLQEQFGFGLCMVTRVDNNDWTVLFSEDKHYGVKAGDVFNWSDSFCSRMVRGEGPNLALDVAEVPAYRDAPIALQLNIQSYVGLPITNGNGQLFGTLCAISPEKCSPELAGYFGVVQLTADLLGCLLHAELKSVDALRRLERTVDSARTDFLTGLFNRRGWDEFLKLEEDRCERYGHPACVVAIDLDNLKQINDREGHARGDAYLRAAAEAIASAVRGSDIAARIGGDEFAILCVECGDAEAAAMTSRLRLALAERKVEASIGVAARRPQEGLHVAAQEADRLMYAEKRRRKSTPPRDPSPFESQREPSLPCVGR